MPGIGKVNLQDVVKSVLTAAVAAVIIYLKSSVDTGNFDIAMIDWGYVINVAISAGIADVVRRLGTTSEGKFLGVVKTS